MFISYINNILFKLNLTNQTTFSLFRSLLRHKSLPEISWLILGQMVSIALGFISMKLLTSMGASEFGKYSLVLTIATLVSSIFYGPAEQGFTRFYYEFANKGKAQTFISLFYKFLLIAGFTFLIITIIAIPVNYFLKTSEQAFGILIMGLYIIIFTSSNIYNSLLNLLRKRKTNAIIQIGERSLTILFLFILTLYTKLNANIALSAILVVVIIVVILKTKVLSAYIPKDIETNSAELKETRKKMTQSIVSFSAPFAIWGATGWLQSNSERWIIAKYLTNADVGIFSIMAILASYLIAIPSGIIGQFAYPIIYEKMFAVDNRHKNAEGIRVYNYFIITIIFLVVLSTVFTIIFGQRLILLISNKEYSSNWQILPLIVIGVGIFNIGQALTIIGGINNVPQRYIFPKIATGVFAVVSNIFFIIYWGLLGAAISICITSIFYLIFIIYANRNLNMTLK